MPNITGFTVCYRPLLQVERLVRLPSALLFIGLITHFVTPYGFIFTVRLSGMRTHCPQVDG